jgi:hypothetical protein
MVTVAVIYLNITDFSFYYNFFNLDNFNIHNWIQKIYKFISDILDRLTPYFSFTKEK